MNCYSNLTRIKSRLDITSTTYNTDLLMLLNAASRAIDDYCSRFFFVDSTTRYFDGQASPAFLDDILAVTTLKTDEDNDGTYENSYTINTDYWLYPMNKYPKTYVVINTNGSYGGFASGIRHAIQIAGNFGYGDGLSATPYASNTTTAEDMTGSETDMDVTSASNLSAGDTILVGSEQMYISSISSNTLTVKRGVNGTTAATSTSGTALYLYQYPDQIVEATLIQAMRWWKRRESAFQDMVGSAEVGQLIAYKGLDADIKLIVEGFKKRAMA